MEWHCLLKENLVNQDFYIQWKNPSEMKVKTFPDIKKMKEFVPLNLHSKKHGRLEGGRKLPDTNPDLHKRIKSTQNVTISNYTEWTKKKEISQTSLNRDWQTLAHRLNPAHRLFLYGLCTKNWRRQWHPTPVLLPGKSHGWRSLVS